VAVLSCACVVRLNVPQGVDFNVIAREWRMKWSTDNDKKSLADAQAALVSVLANVRRQVLTFKRLSYPMPQVKAVPGVQSVQRVVCGGCLDFKVRFTDTGSSGCSSIILPFLRLLSEQLIKVLLGNRCAVCRDIR